MNAPFHARTAYGRPETPVRSPRQIEYDLFARITQRLTSTYQNRQQDYPAFVQALNDNARLWRTLARDLANPGNGLPDPLRKKLCYLAEFSLQHGRKVISAEAEVSVLIDINTSIMRGLRGEGEVR